MDQIDVEGVNLIEANFYDGRFEKIFDLDHLREVDGNVTTDIKLDPKKKIEEQACNKSDSLGKFFYD